MLYAKIGDIVTRNDKYYVSQENKDREYEVTSETYSLCGTEVVVLKGVGAYALDGLDLVRRESEVE